MREMDVAVAPGEAQVRLKEGSGPCAGTTVDTSSLPRQSQDHLLEHLRKLLQLLFKLHLKKPIQQTSGKSLKLYSQATCPLRLRPSGRECAQQMTSKRYPWFGGKQWQVAPCLRFQETKARAWRVEREGAVPRYPRSFACSVANSVARSAASSRARCRAHKIAEAKAQWRL